MKKKTMRNFRLNKKTIVNLDFETMQQVHAGERDRDLFKTEHAECDIAVLKPAESTKKK